MSRNNNLLSGFGALLAGAVFGLGLSVAGMTNPNKVLNFLDITGTWDPSLLFVLGSAVVVFAIAYRLILRSPTPVWEAEYHLPKLTRIDAPLVAGAVIFGVGWGIAGYCPGPAVASVGFANPEALWILPSMVVGTWAHRLWAARGNAGASAAEIDPADA